METEATTSFVPAPDSDHGSDDADSQQGKLMVVGSLCCNRNKFPPISYGGTSSYKPAGLSQLSNPLFNNFLKDIQLSMRDRPTLFYPTLFFLFVILMFVPVFIEPLTYYGASHLLVAILLIWLRVNSHKDLQCEIETRIQEWQPLFTKEGFAVRLVVDKKLCQTTESYLHIYRSQSTDLPFDDGSAPHFKEEANYLLLWVRSFRRRNTTFRPVHLSPFHSLFDTLYAQPPALHNLDVTVFRSLMKDVEVAMQTHAQRVRPFTFVALVAVMIAAHFWTAAFGYSTLVIVASVFIAYALIELVLIHHLPYLTAPIYSTLEEWQPRLAPHGFTVEFRVDQPTWYSLREGYMHIERLESSTNDDNTSNNPIV